MSTPLSTPPATPPTKRSEEYFNSSRLKVIGLITAATVAVGALGGIAGVVFDPDPATTRPQLQPGSGVGSVGSPGQASPRSGTKPRGFSAYLGVRGDDTTDFPSSVGSVSPGSGGFSQSPTPTPSTVVPSPTQGGGGGDGGSGVTMTSTGVDVYVPPGWEVTYQDEQNVAQTNGAGSYSFAFTTTLDPSASAGDVIGETLDVFLPQESYTQRQTSDVVPLEPFGSIVSLAAIGYEALWVDNQGSISVHGEMYVGVRQDGTLLVMLIEHLPAEDFESAIEDMVPIIENSFTRYAGLG